MPISEHWYEACFTNMIHSLLLLKYKLNLHEMALG